MNPTFSHDELYLAQLKSIEQQINQNQLPEAAQQLNMLAKTDSHDPRLFLLGSRLAEAAGNPGGTLQAARKAHQLAPQWHVATIYLAAVLASRGEAEEAISLAERAVRQTHSEPVDQIEMLSRAAAVAQRVNLHPQALQWLRQAEQISPEDLAIRHQIARTLSVSGDAAGAIEILNGLLLQVPGDPVFLVDRLRACLHAGLTKQAVLDGETLVAMDATNEVYQFYFDIARGLTPVTQPSAVVAGLFDGYAARFDHHLVVQLQYKLPRDVAKMISNWHPDRKGDVLDLGCGTGLLGACLGPIEGVLVGVDLSTEMIEKAARHRVYDRFHHVNVLDALQATPAGLYHVITALDVLIYVGNLDEVIPNAHRILMPGGRFVFSCESGSEGEADFVLQDNFRYRHQLSYVQRLLQTAGFESVEIEDRVLRHELGQPVQGFLVTARK